MVRLQPHISRTTSFRDITLLTFSLLQSLARTCDPLDARKITGNIHSSRDSKQELESILVTSGARRLGRSPTRCLPIESSGILYSNTNGRGCSSTRLRIIALVDRPRKTVWRTRCAPWQVVRHEDGVASLKSTHSRWYISDALYSKAVLFHTIRLPGRHAMCGIHSTNGRSNSNRR